jgi:hypothetical protein
MDGLTLNPYRAQHLHEVAASDAHQTCREVSLEDLPASSRALGGGEYKANKSYPEFYPQLAAPRMTISDFERRVAPLSSHC